jgi:Type II secretion system (T2SS), protein N
MKRSIRIAGAAFGAFLIILIARFPAKWAASLLPEGFGCDQIGGTLWSGTCIGLVTRGVPAGDVNWSFHPLKVFTGKLSARLAWARGPANAEGDVDFGLSGAIAARDVKASAPLDPNLMPWVSPNLRGALSANLTALSVQGHAITAIAGQVEGHGIEQNGMSFGDYRLTFPPAQNGAEPLGQLVDLGNGPLKVMGTVKLTREPGYEITGRVQAKPSTPPELARHIEFLGAADGAGMRPFSLAGTY